MHSTLYLKRWFSIWALFVQWKTKNEHNAITEKNKNFILLFLWYLYHKPAFYHKRLIQTTTRIGEPTIFSTQKQILQFLKTLTFHDNSQNIGYSTNKLYLSNISPTTKLVGSINNKLFAILLFFSASNN